MQWLSQLLAKLFKREKEKKVAWDTLNYGKPSDSGDEFRDKNNV